MRYVKLRSVLLSSCVGLLAACAAQPIEPVDEIGVSEQALSVSDCPAGSNIIQGNAFPNLLRGTEGVDCILGLGGSDTIYGLGGNDVLIGGPGLDQIFGGAGDDRIFGDNDADGLYGDAGNDTIDGGGGLDRVYGGEGDDVLTGGSGADYVYGDDGDDAIFGAGLFFPLGDLIDGGFGFDECRGLRCESVEPVFSDCISDAECASDERCVVDFGVCVIETCDDLDADGTCDNVDGCPVDASKVAPGACGCGVSDVDSDQDTVADCNDVCAGGDDTLDADEDGEPNACDITPCTLDAQGYDVWRGDVTVVDAADIEALADITCITGNLILHSETLTDAQGLEALRTILGTFVIRDGAALVSLTGLEQLETIGDRLIIIDNPVLEDLRGLSALTNVDEVAEEDGVHGLWIQTNARLPACWVTVLGEQTSEQCGGGWFACVGNNGVGTCD